MDTSITILLHGLGRSRNIMNPIEKALIAEQINVYNLSYPSTQHDIATLAKTIAERINKKFPEHTFNFVTHSLGSIVVRYMHAHNLLPRIHRVVMLAPPNHGTPVINFLRRFNWFAKFWGPAALQLATDDQGIHHQLPDDVPFECGIIAGNKSIEPWFSWTLLKGENDGKVTVESTKLSGMKDHTLVNVAHPHFPKNPDVIEQVLYFLRHGCFRR